MKYRYLPFLALVVFFLTDCTQKGISQKSNRATQDTLTTYRPHYNYEKEVYNGETIILYPKGGDSLVVFSYDVTRKLDSLLDAKIEKLLIKVIGPGYRIQVYYGNDRNEANRMREKSYSLFPDYRPYLDYKVPTYRVKVGDFEYREDALAVYKAFKKKFAQAIIVPDEVEIIKIATPDDLIELQLKEEEERRKNKNK